MEDNIYIEGDNPPAINLKRVHYLVVYWEEDYILLHVFDRASTLQDAYELWKKAIPQHPNAIILKPIIVEEKLEEKAW